MKERSNFLVIYIKEQLCIPTGKVIRRIRFHKVEHSGDIRDSCEHLWEKSQNTVSQSVPNLFAAMDLNKGPLAPGRLVERGCLIKRERLEK